MSNPRVRLDGQVDGRHTRIVTNPGKVPSIWPKDRWDSALVGEKGYPKTQKAYSNQRHAGAVNRAKAVAEGKMTRRGVPDGRAKQKPQLEVERRNSRTEAEMLTPVLCPDWGNDPDAMIAREAMAVAVADMRCVHLRPSIRLSATRIVLEWSSARLPAGMNIAKDTCESILVALGKEPVPI